MKITNKIQVGITTKIKRGKKKKYSYNDIEYDINGWASSDSFLPLPFDLCLLNCLVKNTTNEYKTKIGWFTGHGWEGRKIDENDVIVGWKRKLNEAE